MGFVESDVVGVRGCTCEPRGGVLFGLRREGESPECGGGGVQAAVEGRMGGLVVILLCGRRFGWGISLYCHEKVRNRTVTARLSEWWVGGDSFVVESTSCVAGDRGWICGGGCRRTGAVRIKVNGDEFWAGDCLDVELTFCVIVA